MNWERNQIKIGFGMISTMVAAYAAVQKIDIPDVYTQRKEGKRFELFKL